MKVKEFSSYIKGLMDGVDLDKTTPEGKVIGALCEIIDQMAGEIEDLKAELDLANEYLEELDEDLGAVEEIIYEDECDCDCDCDCEDDECDCDCDDCCDCCDCEDDEELYCAMCPSCGGKVYFDDTVNPEDVICPACQKPLIEEEDESEEV